MPWHQYWKLIQNSGEKQTSGPYVNASYMCNEVMKIFMQNNHTYKKLQGKLCFHYLPALLLVFLKQMASTYSVLTPLWNRQVYWKDSQKSKYRQILDTYGLTKTYTYQHLSLVKSLIWGVKCCVNKVLQNLLNQMEGGKSPKVLNLMS